MNISRAKEISEAGNTANVTFQGMNVLIQHVDEQTETARIYPPSQPDRELTVPISSLAEN
ncbi:H-type small acid-soluble spore protein [Microbacteriaceae bacterium 4G12]